MKQKERQCPKCKEMYPVHAKHFCVPLIKKYGVMAPPKENTRQESK